MTFCHKLFDVNMKREVNVAELSWPERGEADEESCLGGNRSYGDLRRLVWSEVTRVYNLERELVTAIEEANDPEETYDAIEEKLYEEFDDLYGLDLGVAAAVVALSAGRCIPFSSCNAGAFGGFHHEIHPVVAFYARPKMSGLLLECAEEAGCGLQNGIGGHLIVYDKTILGVMAFAKAVSGRRKSFREIRLSPRSPRNTRSSMKRRQLNLF